ncbi:hypothetical protein JCM14469_09680 [Desulfatiferula olefinivorans]
MDETDVLPVVTLKIVPPAALPGDRILKIRTNGLGSDDATGCIGMNPIACFVKLFQKVWLPAGPPEALKCLSRYRAKLYHQGLDALHEIIEIRAVFR